MLRATAGAFGPAGITSGTISGTPLTAAGGIVTLADKSCIPMISVSSGTMGNNGALSAITALGRVYAKCYMFFPAGAIATGVPGVGGGWFYVEMASTTAGTVFNNAYTSGAPTVPATKTPFVTTGPGAFVGDLTEQGVLLNVTGGAMGALGAISTYLLASANNTAGAKTFRIRFGGIAGTVYYSVNLANNVTLDGEVMVSNTGVANAQVGPSLATSSSSYGVSSSAPVTSAVDTSANFTIAVTAQKGVATDNMVIECVVPEVFGNGV